MPPASSHPSYPWLMLVSRLVLFAVFQALIGLALRLSGVPDAWNESARWWLFSVIVTNLVSIFLLVRLFRAEGRRYVDLLRFERQTFWKDLALAVGALLLAGPIGFLPGNLVATMLYGDAGAPAAMMFRPLPLWAILTGLLFPLTIAFAELPTYFGYVMPRLEQRLGSGWLAWALASLGLSFQHMTLPLILDWRFLLWRGLMFLPFALFVGWVLKVRPRLLPYLLVSHFLIDLAALSTYLML